MFKSSILNLTMKIRDVAKTLRSKIRSFTTFDIFFDNKEIYKKVYE